MSPHWEEKSEYKYVKIIYTVQGLLSRTCGMGIAILLLNFLRRWELGNTLPDLGSTPEELAPDQLDTG